MYSHVLCHYSTLIAYYEHDQLQRKMLMWQFSGRQRTYEEAAKFFTGGSKKYGPDRNVPPVQGALKKNKWRVTPPIEFDPRYRTIIAFGDASCTASIRGISFFRESLSRESNKPIYRYFTKFSQDLFEILEKRIQETGSIY